jgi:hypothetical protein
MLSADRHYHRNPHAYTQYYGNQHSHSGAFYNSHSDLDIAHPSNGDRHPLTCPNRYGYYPKPNRDPSAASTSH